MLRAAAIAALFFVPFQVARAQDTGPAALKNALAMLRDDVPRVLYIAAHPDDEDTRLITWLSRGGRAEVAYLSLNRGEGGQNLIGPELGDALGVLRTEELLSARRVDGARQFFTRAYDFGYSKSAEEAFSHWPRDSILGDMVRIVRAFRPHVLASTFSGTPRDAHGQHQVAGILTREVYDVADDTVRFPVARFGRPWRPLKLYRLATFSPNQATLQIDVGRYDPLAGRTYDEIAAESRSQHKTQGYRRNNRLGPVIIRYFREATRVNENTPANAERWILEGVPVADVPGAEEGGITAIDFSNPADALEAIAAFTPRDERAEARYDRAARLAAALAFEAVPQRPFVAVGDSVMVQYTLHNRGGVPVRVDSAAGSPKSEWIQPGATLAWTAAYRPSGVDQPWWLARPRRGDLYATPSTGMSDDEIARASWHLARVSVTGLRRPVRVAAPPVHRFSEPPYGDVLTPLAVAPGVTLTPSRAREYVRAGQRIERDVSVTLRSSFDTARTVSVQVDAPGLTVTPRETQVVLPSGGTRVVTFRLTGTRPGGFHRVSIAATVDGRRYDEAVQIIDYPHVAPRRIYRDATVTLTAVEVAVPANLNVAYIAGTADDGPLVLRDLGVPVTMIEPADIARTDLSRFTAVVVGPRAYEAHPEVLEHNQRLFDYVRAGGRMVVQFGQYPMATPGILPYRITISRPPDRVTDERAPVTITDPGARELTFPNRIGPADFDGWVQERATFMPREFDPQYRTMLAMNDPGEDPKRTSILVAPLSRGTYVYVTLALFRQFGEGVPGAARLFVNLLAP